MKTCVIVGQNYPDKTLECIVDQADRIIIFEPLPDAVQACRYAYKDSASVIVIEAACGELFGYSQFHRYNLNGVSSSLGTMTGEAVELYSGRYDLSLNETFDVQVVNLGSVLKWLGVIQIDLLFIDAQGMDFTILKTVEAWIAESAISVIQIEADGAGFRHYDGLPENSEEAAIKWMERFPEYKVSRLPGRMEQQPDLVFELKG